MKRKFFYSALAILGVFLMIDTPLLAQSTGTSSSRSSSRARATSRVVVPAVPDVEDIEMHDYNHSFVYTTTSSDKNSKLTLSKRYEGTTATKNGAFKVEDGVKKIRISITGKVEQGKINVELYLPDGKDVGKFQMDDTADVNWSQSIGIDEEETKYYGEWTYIIKTEDAHGYYSLSLSTY